MHFENIQPYSLSFTAASLRPELARVVAEAFLESRDWKTAKEAVLSSNLLQDRSTASSIRREMEFRHRIQTLTLAEIEILAKGSTESRTAMAWLSVLKRTAFIFDFVADILRGKAAELELIVRPSDYENFVAAQSTIHPELAKLTGTTSRKIRQVTKTMLVEAGLVKMKNGQPLLTRPVVPAEVAAVILDDQPKWLAGFLVPDSEIKAMRGGR